MGISRTFSEINGDFSQQSQIFHIIYLFHIIGVFNAPAEAVPLGIGYRRKRSKIRVMGLPDGRKKNLR